MMMKGEKLQAVLEYGILAIGEELRPRTRPGVGSAPRRGHLPVLGLDDVPEILDLVAAVAAPADLMNLRRSMVFSSFVRALLRLAKSGGRDPRGDGL